MHRALLRARAHAAYAAIVSLRTAPAPVLQRAAASSLSPAHPRAPYYLPAAATVAATSSVGASPNALASAGTTVALPDDASAAVLTTAVSGLDAGFPTWPTSWLSYALMNTINELRDQGGLEWWSAIVTTSVLLRVVTVPPALYSQRTSAWFGHFKEEIAALTARIRIANEASDREAAARAFQDYQAFLTRNKLSIVKGMLAPIISQAFVFISMFSALRWLVKDAALVPGFLDATPFLLTVPDPSYALVLASTVFTVSSVVLNQNVVGMPDRGLSANGQKLAFAGLSVIFSGVTAFMPAAIQLHLAVSAATSLTQNVLLRIPGLPKAIGFPSTYPLKPATAHDARTELAAVLAGTKKLAASPFDAHFTSLRPAMVRITEIADGNWRKTARLEYMSWWGLRDPGVPPPPPTPPPQALAVPLSAAAAVAAMSTSMKISSSATTRPPADGQQLLLSRPRKK